MIWSPTSQRWPPPSTTSARDWNCGPHRKLWPVHPFGQICADVRYAGGPGWSCSPCWCCSVPPAGKGPLLTTGGCRLGQPGRTDPPDTKAAPGVFKHRGPLLFVLPFDWPDAPIRPEWCDSIPRSPPGWCRCPGTSPERFPATSEVWYPHRCPGSSAHRRAHR